MDSFLFGSQVINAIIKNNQSALVVEKYENIKEAITVCLFVNSKGKSTLPIVY